MVLHFRENRSRLLSSAIPASGEAKIMASPEALFS
jgi:hypothetical protein